MKKHLLFSLSLLGFAALPFVTPAHGKGSAEAPTGNHAPAPIHFQYFDAEVAAANQSSPLDAKALHALGERWVRQCSEGGAFAVLAPTFAPDPGLSAKLREADLKRFDRSRFEALAMAAWRKAGVGLPLWLLFSTRYVLGHGQLVVRSGPFRWRIGLADITSIKPTSNPLSSPALSLDRLRIEYGRGRSLMISPRDKERFVRDVEAATHGKAG